MSYLKQREVWDLRWENSAGYWAGCWKTMWASTVWKHVTIGMKKRVRECVFLLFNELLWCFQQHLQSESESLGLIHCSPSCSNRPPVAFGGHKSFLTADLCIQVRSTFEKWNVTYRPQWFPLQSHRNNKFHHKGTHNLWMSCLFCRVSCLALWLTASLG